MLKTKEFTIRLEEIDAGENPLRLEGHNKGIAELTESISSIGLINPLVVAPGADGYRYRLIAGHRRFAACRRAGLKEVQVRIIEGDQREICEIALAENLFRKDLSPVPAGRDDKYSRPAGTSPKVQPAHTPSAGIAP